MLRTWIEIGLMLAGAVTLTVGYRRNSRNVLLAGALLLFASGTAVDFVRGVGDGWKQSTAQTL